MQELTQIARQHPESVAFLFSQYGYEKIPVNGESIQAMGVKFGHKFLEDLAAQISNEDEFSNVTGESMGLALNKVFANQRNVNGSIGKPKNLGIIAPRANIAQNLVVKQPVATNIKPQKPGFFNKVLDLLERGSGIYAGVKQTQMEANNQVFHQEQTERKRDNTLLIAGAAVVAILVFALLFFKGKTTVK